MTYVLTCIEVQNYNKNKVKSSRLKNYWEDFIKQLPSNLKKEAENKGYTLTHHPINSDSLTEYSENFMFNIPNASKKLHEATLELQNILICMKDPV